MTTLGGMVITKPNSLELQIIEIITIHARNSSKIYRRLRYQLRLSEPLIGNLVMNWPSIS